MQYMTTASLALLALSVAVSAFPAPQNDAKHMNQPCYEDNPLRALEHNTSVANSFCPGYLTANGKVYPPKQLGNFKPWEFYSACSCYKKTALGGTFATATSILGPTALGGNGPIGGTGSGAPYPLASATALMGTAPTGSALIVTGPVGTAPVGTATLGTAQLTIPSAMAGVVANTAGSSTAESSPVAAASSPVITSSGSTASATIAGGSIGAGSPAGPIKPGSKGKRGIAYNQKSQNGWSALFKGSLYAVWGSNWSDSRDDALDSSFTYVPTIAVDKSLSNADWLTTIPNLIQSGTTTLFGSNEPDNAGQANLQVSDCVTVHKKYMQPFAGKAALGTPAVTNGGGAAGLAYLDSFASSCTGCSFNFINVHFYLQRSDVNTVQFSEAFKKHIDINIPAIQAKHDNLQGLPIMIGEFWLTGASDQEGENLMLDLLPYLDGNDKIMGYQAFGGLFEGNFITADGTGLTPAAQKYNTYSAPPSMTSAL